MSLEGSVRKQVGRFDLLDIARFLCAAWVLLYHYVYTYGVIDHGRSVAALPGLISQYGYMGVEFFFIISGFVIAYSSRGKTALQFFESRFFRIWPIFVVCMSATALVLHLSGERPFDPVDYLANLTVMPAYLGVQPYEGVYWTLTYEIFFYSIVFVLILLRVRRFDKVMLIAGPMVLLGMALLLMWEASYLSLFLIGMAFYTLTQGSDRGVALVSLVLMIPLATYGAWFRGEELGNNGLLAGAIMIAMFLIFALLTLSPLAGISLKRARDIGLVTYPLYLLHSRIGTMLMDSFGSEATWAIWVCGIGVAMVLASWLISRLDSLIVQKHLRSFYRTSLHRLATSKVRS